MINATNNPVHQGNAEQGRAVLVRTLEGLKRGKITKIIPGQCGSNNSSVEVWMERNYGRCRFLFEMYTEAISKSIQEGTYWDNCVKNLVFYPA